MKILIILFSFFLFFCAGITKHSGTFSSTPEKIRVLTYNIHHANPPSEPDSIDLPAIARVINEQAPDLVALQEIDVHTGRSGPYHEAAWLAEKTGLNFYFVKSIEYDGGEYGIAILSRFPILEKQRYALPSNPDTGGEPRMLAAVTITLPNGEPLIFACTHLDARKDPENRHLQINKIVEILKNASHPVILAGDFNDRMGTETIQTLDTYFERTCQECEPTIPADTPLHAIDFIATRPKGKFKVITQRTVPEGYASDHRPVFAVLQVLD